MKKLIAIVVAVMMIAVVSVSVSVSVFATDTTKITVDAEQLAAGAAAGNTLSDPAVQTKGEIKQVGVKATEKTPEAAANAYFEVPVTVDADCASIVIKVTYHGNDDARYFAIRWNGAIVADDIGGDNAGNGGNYQTDFHEETVIKNVVAGEYKVGVACPSGFGTGAISKTANISKIELTLTYATTTAIALDAEQLAAGAAEGNTLSDSGVQTKGEIKQVGVKATEKTPEAAAKAYFEVPVTVDADCTAIVIKVTYHGNDDARYFAIRWNGAVVADDIGGDNAGNGGNYQTPFYEETVVENVEAGVYKVGVACPSGFGAGTISKTANISKVELTLFYAERAPETTESETPETTETEAPETTETEAPETTETEAPETTETEAPETTETEAPETTETEAPETTETEAPETEAPETEAPETEAPETEAPETEAPETEAPETEAPETDAPETDAPETDAPETDAPVGGEGGEGEEDAPQTGFVAAALMVVAIGSGAYIVSRKH